MRLILQKYKNRVEMIITEKETAKKIFHEFMDHLLSEDSLEDLTDKEKFEIAITEEFHTAEFRELVKGVNAEELRKELMVICTYEFSLCDAEELKELECLEGFLELHEELILDGVANYDFANLLWEE